MSIVRGQDMTLSLSDGGNSFTPIAGLRTRSVSLRAATATVSSVDSGPWRRLLCGGGAQSADVSGTGLFVDDAAANRVRAIFFANEHVEWQIGFPSSGLMRGLFQITTLDLAGSPGIEASFSIALASAGPLTTEKINV